MQCLQFLFFILNEKDVRRYIYKEEILVNSINLDEVLIYSSQ